MKQKKVRKMEERQKTNRTVVGIKCPKCGHPVWVELERTQGEAESGVIPYACQKCGYERYFE